MGLCLGPGRGPGGGWLIDIEGDGPEAEESRTTLFGGEAVESRGRSSARGAHMLLIVDWKRLAPMLPRLRGYESNEANQSGKYEFPEFPGLEFRLGGKKPDGSYKQFQSVCPPSPGTDGKPRAWTGPETIAEAPESFYATLERIAEATEAKAQAPPQAPTPARTPAGSGRPSAEDRAIRYLAKCDPAVSGQRGHNKAFGVACRVGPGFDLDPGTTVRLLLKHYNPNCKPPWTEGEIRHKVTDAYAKESKRGWLPNSDRDRPGRRRPRQDRAPAPDAPAPAARPDIEINTDLHLALQAALEALRAAPDIYIRGDMLVRIAVETEVMPAPGSS